MKSERPHSASRRGFLRGAAVAAVLGPVFGVPKVEAETPGADSEDIALLGQIVLNGDVYEHNSILKGSLRFLRLPKSEVEVQWIDSFGRIAGEYALPAPTSLAEPLPFFFDLRDGLTYMNSIRVKVNGVVQAVASRFMRSPAESAWNDYQVISWAHYPDGYYDQLRAAGVNATIAYREGDFSNVLNNNFNFYVEQMVWDVYAIYHKDLPLWRDVIAKVRADRSNLEHWVRQPCVNDPATQKYVNDRVQRYVRQHRAFRPLYYCISDELGQGDQISANDFCHSVHCTLAFAEYLRKKYGTLQGLQGEWALDEVIRWDDEGIQSGSDWEKANPMISRTTTDAAFESIALANLQERYGSVSRFNKEWGTSFPEPRGGMGPRESWEPVLGAVRESLSIPHLAEPDLEKALGSLEQFNVRCGNRAGWNAPHTPAGFKSWSEVKAFLIRYDKELGEVKSTKGWNLAPWSDFRNFMDSTFADAVLRAAVACKAEDPSARCATEGGQAPFAFGWYNYEQVLRVVDVIEPYNIGNNVEVIRSLKPETIMLSTVGYDHKPGSPMTAEDRLRQRQAVRPVWWELFHSHQGTIIWDNQEESGTFVDLKTGALTIPAETFRDVFHELRGGLGMLVMNIARTQDGIAIHYSHPSVQAHWLLENAPKAREWMVDTVEGYVTSRFIAVRNSWTKLVEDLQVQYDFVSASEVAAGGLNSGKYKLFVLPESIALSPAEAEQVREFVLSGGTVIADSRVGLLNEHCRDFGHAQLNDVFGIAAGERRNPGALASVDASATALQLAEKDLGHLEPADAMLAVTTAKAMVHSGDVPMVAVNRLGKGQAIYLNMDVSGYAFDRLNPNAPNGLQSLLESVLSVAGIGERVRVRKADGKRLAGTEVVIFANGVCEVVAIFRNPQLDDGGWGSYREKKSNWRDWTTDADNSALEKEENVTIEWGSASQTYDVRAKKDLGSIETYKAVLDPWEPLVFTRAPRPLPRLQLGVPSGATAGSTIELTIKSSEAPLEGTLRVVHLEFTPPSGKVYELYSQNVLVSSSSQTVRVPIAANDPQGTWSVRGHDLMSGQISEGSFTVRPRG